MSVLFIPRRAPLGGFSEGSTTAAFSHNFRVVCGPPLPARFETGASEKIRPHKWCDKRRQSRRISIPYFLVEAPAIFNRSLYECPTIPPEPLLADASASLSTNPSGRLLRAARSCRSPFAHHRDIARDAAEGECYDLVAAQHPWGAAVVVDYPEKALSVDSGFAGATAVPVSYDGDVA